MVGLPGSGKSTWTMEDTPNLSVILSSDGYIEAWAREEGKTYDEVFQDKIKEASQKFEKDLTEFINSGSNIIIDRTNLTTTTRKRYLNKLPSDYEKVAVVMKTHALEAYMRMRKRKGKVVPEEKFIKMVESYEEPTLAEGFDRIIYV